MLALVLKQRELKSLSAFGGSLWPTSSPKLFRRKLRRPDVSQLLWAELQTGLGFCVHPLGLYPWPHSANKKENLSLNQRMTHCRKMMGFPFQKVIKHNKSNLGGTGVPWGGQEEGREDILGKAGPDWACWDAEHKLAPYLKLEWAQQGPKMICEAKLADPGSQQVSWVRRGVQVEERGLGDGRHASADLQCSQLQPLILCPRWSGAELPKGRLKTENAVWENVSNTSWKFKTSTHHKVSDKLNSLLWSAGLKPLEWSLCLPVKDLAAGDPIVWTQTAGSTYPLFISVVSTHQISYLKRVSGV